MQACTCTQNGMGCTDSPCRAQRRLLRLRPRPPRSLLRLALPLRLELERRLPRWRRPLLRERLRLRPLLLFRPRSCSGRLPPPAPPPRARVLGWQGCPRRWPRRRAARGSRRKISS